MCQRQCRQHNDVRADPDILPGIRPQEVLQVPRIITRCKRLSPSRRKPRRQRIQHARTKRYNLLWQAGTVQKPLDHRDMWAAGGDVEWDEICKVCRGS